jgi:hypothetical protein
MSNGAPVRGAPAHHDAKKSGNAPTRRRAVSRAARRLFPWDV